MFIKVHVIIVIRFCDSNVLGPIYIDMQYIDFYIEGGGSTWLPIQFSFIIHKTETLQKHDLSKDQILHYFHRTIFFVG